MNKVAYVAAIVVGIILLFPGACAAFFMVAMLGGNIESGLFVLFAICFAASALGIVLIKSARNSRLRAKENRAKQDDAQ